MNDVLVAVIVLSATWVGTVLLWPPAAMYVARQLRAHAAGLSAARLARAKVRGMDLELWDRGLAVHYVEVSAGTRAGDDGRGVTNPGLQTCEPGTLCGSQGSAYPIAGLVCGETQG